MDYPDFILDLYKAPVDDSVERLSSGELGRLFDGVYTMFETDPVRLNSILETMPVDTLCTLGLVGVLRYTFALKDKLSAWRGLLIRAHAELTTRPSTEDKHSLLTGLIDYLPKSL
jgi:hypothetical protein